MGLPLEDKYKQTTVIANEPKHLRYISLTDNIGNMAMQKLTEYMCDDAK